MEVLTIIGGALGGIAAIYTAIRLPRIESIRSNLRRAEVRSSRLYEERLTVLTATWERVVDAHSAIREYVAPLREAGRPPVEESGRTSRAAYNELLRYFERNRILLPEATADQAWQLIQRMRGIVTEFDRLQEDHEAFGGVRRWKELWDETTDELPKVREAFESAARAILDGADD